MKVIFCIFTLILSFSVFAEQGNSVIYSRQKFLEDLNKDIIGGAGKFDRTKYKDTPRRKASELNAEKFAIGRCNASIFQNTFDVLLDNHIRTQTNSATYKKITKIQLLEAYTIFGETISSKQPGISYHTTFIEKDETGKIIKYEVKCFTNRKFLYDKVSKITDKATPAADVTIYKKLLEH